MIQIYYFRFLEENSRLRKELLEEKLLHEDLPEEEEETPGLHEFYIYERTKLITSQSLGTN